MRRGHSEAYRYGWNFFADCIDEIVGKHEGGTDAGSEKMKAQDDLLREMGVLEAG